MYAVFDRIGRDKDAVPAEEVQPLVGRIPPADRPAALDAQQGTEGVGLGFKAGQAAAALRIHGDLFHLEPGAAAQQFDHRPGAKAHDFHRLARCGAAAEVCHLQRPLYMQRPLFAVFVNTVIVIQAVGDIGALLHLGDKTARAERVHLARGDVEYVALPHRDLLQMAQQCAVGDARADRLAVGVVQEAVNQVRPFRGLDHVPHFALAARTVLVDTCIVVRGVYLYRKVVPRVDKFHKHRQLRAVRQVRAQIVRMQRKQLAQRQPRIGAAAHDALPVRVGRALPGLGQRRAVELFIKIVVQSLAAPEIVLAARREQKGRALSTRAQTCACHER